MKSYCTEIDREDGEYSGPIVVAEDWPQAEIAAAEIGCRVRGELAFVSDVAGNVLLLGSAILGDSTPATSVSRMFPGTER